MIIRKFIFIVVVFCSVFVSFSVFVKIIVDEVVCLGNDLMLIGVEKVVNKDGFILVWMGGIIIFFVDYKLGMYYLDLFVDDKVLFIIDKLNVDKYKEYLSFG